MTDEGDKLPSEGGAKLPSSTARAQLRPLCFFSSHFACVLVFFASMLASGWDSLSVPPAFCPSYETEGVFSGLTNFSNGKSVSD